MVSFFLSIEAKSLACTIHEFQCNTSNKKISCMNTALQTLVDCIITTKLIDCHLLDIPRRKTRAVASTSLFFTTLSGSQM